MILKKTIELGRELISPQYGADLPVFMHCTGGSIAVTVDAFENFMYIFDNHCIEIRFPVVL